MYSISRWGSSMVLSMSIKDERCLMPGGGAPHDCSSVVRMSCGGKGGGRNGHEARDAGRPSGRGALALSCGGLGSVNGFELVDARKS